MPSLSFLGLLVGGLALEQAALALGPQTVAAELAIAADDTVAGYDQRNGIGGAGVPDRALGVGLTESAGDIAIAARLAQRDAPQFLPHPALEGGPADIERQVDVGLPAGDEVDDRPHRRGHLQIAALDTLRGRKFAAQPLFQLIGSGPQADETDAALGRRHDQLAERRSRDGIANTGPAPAFGVGRRGHAERRGRPLIDAARGAVAGVVSGGGDAIALLEPGLETLQPMGIRVLARAHTH